MEASGVVELLRESPCGRRLLSAASGGSGVWLVGGAVRDMVLGNAPRELDVAVEGDVGALAAALGGAVTVHERFGTATVEDAGCRFDLARTRHRGATRARARFPTSAGPGWTTTSRAAT